MLTCADGFSFAENGDPEEVHYYKVDGVLFSGKTNFQNMMILDTERFGKLLVLDGRVQSAQNDEHIYHESLVHPALITHPNPRNVLIIGGGEGATLREALRHPSVNYVAMIDIDGEVVDNCRRMLPEWSQGAFDDQRTELFITDGKDFVANTATKFDCVIIDICDALEDGPAIELYSGKFYNDVKRLLNPGGIVVVQAMEFSNLVNKDHVFVHMSLRQIFQSVRSYAQYVPSFWCNWSFVIASDVHEPETLKCDEINRRMRLRGLDSALVHYDGDTHAHMFSLPKANRRVLDQACMETLQRNVA